jgi:hypothetical protein
LRKLLERPKRLNRESRLGLRRASIGLILVVAGVTTACEPTPAPPAASSALQNWQPTAAVWTKLSRPVSALNGDGVIVTERDSGVVVPASLICKNGSNDVPCSASRINGFWIVPTHGFTLGQYYKVSFASRFLISNQPPITGNGVFRAGPREDDQASTPTYSWHTGLSRGALGGSYTDESANEAHAALAFNGTWVTVWTITGASHGLMDVYVDQVLRRTYNDYSATTRYRVPVTVTGLAPGPHRLDVVVRGAKGTSAATGTDVVVDGVSSAGGTLVTPAFEFGWSNGASPSFSQGWTSSSQTTGAVASIRFRGTAIQVGILRGPYSGIYRAYMDGKAIGEFSEGSTSSFGIFNRTFTAAGDVVHRLDLLVLGRHTKWSIANLVSVDYWQIPTTSLPGPALHALTPAQQGWSRTQYLPNGVPAAPRATAPADISGAKR